MSEQTGKKGTFYSLAKWFRWASIIIILAPVVALVFAIIQVTNDAGWVDNVTTILGWVVLAAGAIWFILIVILFCTAGRVKDQINALATRLWLLIALALVLAPAIISGLQAAEVINLEGAAYTAVAIAMPIANIVGYIVAAVTAGRAKRKLA